MRQHLLAAAFFALAGSLSAAPITVSGTTTFDSGLIGTFGDWAHTFNTSGDPNIVITSIKIDLSGSNLRFDTAPGGFGFVASQDVATISEGGTGFTGFSASGAGLDGGTMVTLGFTSFGAGKTYSHTGDVDENLTLLALANCNALPVLQRPACIANNVIITAQNVLITADASLTDGSELVGAKVIVSLGGTNVVPTQLEGLFGSTGGNTASASWRGTVEVVPEPSTYALMGAGLIGVIGFARRRRS